MVLRLATVSFLFAELLSAQPTAQSVRAAVEQEFGGIFTVTGASEQLRISPVFVTGDFNGDGTTDLVVLATPRTDQIKAHLAKDPHWSIPTLTITKVLSPAVTARQAKEAQISMADFGQNFKDAAVLLILHDFGKPAAAGSRYALVDFCNSRDLSMTVSRKPLKSTSAGDSGVIAAPRLKSDTLRFLDKKNEGTAVYWDGARYLWYPVE